MVLLRITDFMRYKDLLVLTFTVFFFSGCAGKTLVVLVPDTDGTTGRISVSNAAGTVALENPHQAVSVKDSSTLPGKAVAIKKEKSDALFSEALSIEPSRPEHFILYFKTDDVVLTPASSNLIPDIFSCIEKRESKDISTIGHTDTVGDRNYNMTLSRRRASAVKELLVKHGLNPDFIRTTSHGEGNPLIRTKDNVIEPRNRRVEVIVR